MRPGIAAAVAVSLLVVGCGGADETSDRPVVRLASVTFPQAPFVARADAPPAAVREATARARADADATAVREATAGERAGADATARDRATSRASGRGSTDRGATAGSDIAPGAPSDAEVRAQLRELYGESGATPPADDLGRSVTLTAGQVTAPPDAPTAVQRIVAAANQVARLPYVYGGGHGRAEGLFVDSAYDCSGSISFALANAGLVDRPLTSGELARWGKPGQGRWVTIYANADHAFMVVGGARFDTVGLRETGSRWQRPMRAVRGFTAVHPAGL